MNYGVRVLRFASLPVTPWRNGRGVTRELASAAVAAATGVASATGTAPLPAWRLSMATISQDAPFSHFPNQVRTLGIIDGNGIELKVDGQAHTLTIGQTFGPFSGEVAASARPVDGPSLDVGLMLDPSRAQGEFRPISAGRHELVGFTWFVVSLVDGLTLTLNDGEPVSLQGGDSAALDLRTAPVAQLTVTVSHADTVASALPVAYLVSISR